MLGDAKVAYIPTTNLAQGMAALFNFDAERDLVENSVIMTEEAKMAISGAITIAVRDSVVNGIKVTKGDYLGLLNDKIICAGSDMEEVLEKLLDDGDYELISMYYGSDVSKEQAEEIADKLQEMNEDWEIEMFNGGQPLYPLLLSME